MLEVLNEGKICRRDLQVLFVDKLNLKHLRKKIVRLFNSVYTSIIALTLICYFPYHEFFAPNTL